MTKMHFLPIYFYYEEFKICIKGKLLSIWNHSPYFDRSFPWYIWDYGFICL